MRLPCSCLVPAVPLCLALACAGGGAPRDDASDSAMTDTANPPTASSSSGSGPTEASATVTDGATDSTTAPTGGQTDGQTVTSSPTEAQTESQTESQTDSQTESQTDATTDGTTTAVTATTTDTTDTTMAQTDTGPDDTTDTGVEACPCPDLDVPLDDGIFVLSKTAALWKYLPGDNEFMQLGALDCGLPPSTFSMGVDRQGFAWVQFSDQQIRKVDVTDVTQCSDPGFVPGQDGVENFGMAFVSNSAEDKCDRIYGNHYNFVAQGDGISEFFSVDPVTLDLVQLGKSDYGLAELTGTGDGRAFLFAGPDPSKLVEVDKASGATLDTIPLPGVKTGGGFAFAFFAGDFYFFTDNMSDSKSEVTHLDYDDSDNNGLQDLKVIYNDAPLRIVGAGVSTCAPLIPQ